MADVRSTGSPEKTPELQSVRSESPDPAQPNRNSSLRSHANSLSDNKIDVVHSVTEPHHSLTEPHNRQLIATQKNTKFWESNRRFDRIVDIAHMLEDNDALTPDEKDWLKDLGKRHYDRYCELGDMLQVHKYWRPGHHRVPSLEDRNKIRMQTMKLFLNKAMKTAGPNDSWWDRESAAVKALIEAKDMRLKIGQKTELRDLKMHNDVTEETLLDPDLFMQKYERRAASEKLYAAVQRRNIHPNISRHDRQRAARAVEYLVNNDLLTMVAAEKLLDAFKKYPQQISAAVSDTGLEEVEPGPDREKVRALALLALAYNNADTAKDMRDDLMTKVDDNGLDVDDDFDDDDVDAIYESLDDGNRDVNYKQRFRWLPDLPASGSARPENRDKLLNDRDQWCDWAVREIEDQAYDGGSDNDTDVDDENKNKKLNTPHRQTSSSFDFRSAPKVNDQKYRRRLSTQIIESDNDDDQTYVEDNGPSKEKASLSGNEIKKDIPDNVTENKLTTESKVEETHKKDAPTGRIPIEVVDEPNEDDPDIPDIPDSPQKKPYKLMDEDPSQTGQQGTRNESEDSTSANTQSSIGTSSSKKVIHKRNETTHIRKTNKDSDIDNSLEVKKIQDIYSKLPESENDTDDEEFLNESNMTSEERRKFLDNAINESKERAAKIAKNDDGKDDNKLSKVAEEPSVAKDANKVDKNNNNNDSKSDESSSMRTLNSFKDDIGKNELPASQPVITGYLSDSIKLEYFEIKLGANKKDDKKLMNAMTALGAEKWSETPLGKKPLVDPDQEFVDASTGLLNDLSILGGFINSVLKAYDLSVKGQKGIKANDADQRTGLTVSKGMLIQIETVKKDAKDVKSKLGSLRETPEYADVLKTAKFFDKRRFNTDIDKAIKKLDTIIGRCDIVLQRGLKAGHEQYNSLNNNNNNNNNNNDK